MAHDEAAVRQPLEKARKQRRKVRIRIEIVDPGDVRVLSPSGTPELTLITCYPTYYLGPAPQRLVVFSKLVESGKALAEQR